MPKELMSSLKELGLTEKFATLNYSTRKEFASSVSEAKADETRQRRIDKIIVSLK